MNKSFYIRDDMANNFEKLWNYFDKGRGAVPVAAIIKEMSKYDIQWNDSFIVIFKLCQIKKLMLAFRSGDKCSLLEFTRKKNCIPDSAKEFRPR